MTKTTHINHTKTHHSTQRTISQLTSLEHDGSDRGWQIAALITVAVLLALVGLALGPARGRHHRHTGVSCLLCAHPTRTKNSAGAL